MIKGIVGMVLCWVLVASAFFVTTPTGESSRSEDGDIGTEIEPTQVRVGFTENCGQLDDDPVRYYVQGRGIWLQDDGVVMDIQQPTEEGNMLDLRDLDADFDERMDQGVQRKGAVLKLCFDGANDVTPEGRDLMEQRSGFYYGDDPDGWLNDVPHFERVVYREVYDEIDLVFCFTGEGLKYEFWVHPGGEPDDIQLRYEGAEGLIIKSQGELEIKAGEVALTDSGLYIYQQGNKGESVVEGGFKVLDATSYGFDITGKYHKNKDLIIDPLLYSTFVGFEANEAGTDIAVDEHGDAYVTGTTSSSGFPTTTGVYDTTINGMFDVFVFKLRPAGGGTTDLIYSTFIGGSENDVGYGIHVEAGGYAYVTGGTQSYDFPTTALAYDTSYNGGWDVFVLKLNPTATAPLMYSTFIGGELHEIGMDVEADSYRFAYVTGLTASPAFPATTGVPAGGYDVFSLKLNPAGSGLAYSLRVGGKLFDAGTAIALDSGYKAYVTGYTISIDFPTTATAYSPVPNGGIDAFVFRVNPAGNSLEFSTYIGGTTGDMGQGIDLDDSGNAYVTGTTNSPAFPTTVGAYSTVLAGGVDVFALVLDVTGSFLHYSTYVGGPKADWGFDIAIDEDKVMYVTGFTNSNPFPTTLGAYDTTYNGNWDVFVFKLEPAGGGSADLLYSTYVGGHKGEGGYGIAVDELKDAYVTGLTRSYTFPTTSGAYDEWFNGNFDVFVFKLTLEPMSGAAKMKIEAANMLIVVKPKDKQEARMLATAVEEIRMSLDGSRWVDGTHLETKHGAKVFDHERKAVHELERLMGTTQDRELLAACQGAMDKLVVADRLLAMTAFGDACRNVVDSVVEVPYDGELEKCKEELEKAQQEAEEGNEGAAIHHYGKAWQCAQRAMMHDDNDGNWFVDDS